jgi:hypothetical protein
VLRALKCFVAPFLAGFLLISTSSVFVSTSSGTMPTMALEAASTWVPAGSLAYGRHAHTATLLSDGLVLIVGGLQERVAGSPGLASVEVYDPVSGTWNVTGSLDTGRWGHTAALLPDGTVLVAGGRADYSGPALASAEIYDPVSGTWSPAPPLSVPRCFHSSTRLADDRVLVAGGRFGTGGSEVHASAEIYDPVTGAWSPAGSLSTPREGHSATLLPDGQVLVVNGYYQTWLASAEVYDPVSGAWNEIAAPLACHGVAHTATLMFDGRVLIVGGACGAGTPGIRDDVEIYDPATLTWLATTALPAVREAHTASVLPDGSVLIVGGDNGDLPRYDSALIYDPASGLSSPTGSLATGRRNHTATLLDDGSVLVAGGWGDNTTYLETVERYQETVADTPTPTHTPTQMPLPPTQTHTPVPPTNTPRPPTQTPAPPPPTHTPVPPTLRPPPTLTSTPLPPTELPVSGENLNLVLTGVLASLACIIAIIGVVSVVVGVILYARSARKR